MNLFALVCLFTLLFPYWNTTGICSFVQLSHVWVLRWRAELYATRQSFLSIFFFTLLVHSHRPLATGGSVCLAFDDLAPTNKLPMLFENSCLKIQSLGLAKYPPILSMAKNSAFLLLLLISHLQSTCALWSLVVLYAEKGMTYLAFWVCFFARLNIAKDIQRTQKKNEVSNYPM